MWEYQQLSFYEIDYRAGNAGFVSEPHAHDHYEIFFMEQGNASHFIDFKEYPIVDHSLFLVSANQVHYITAPPNTYNRGMVLSVDKKLIEVLDLELFQLFGSITISPAYRIESNGFFSTVFGQIRKELNTRQPGSVSIVFDLLKVLLTYIWRQSSKQPFEKQKNEDAFMKFINQLENHFITIKSVKGFAQLMNLTTGQLNRICKANSQQTALQLIHARINLEAKRKICFGQKQIKDIAYELGFEDTGHFTNFFKKMNNVSPVKFRTEMSQIFNGIIQIDN